MKKHKMLISLAGLAAVVATTATVAAYTLAGDGASGPTGESVGTEEPAVDVGGPSILDPGPGQMSDDGTSVSVDNPDTGGGAIGIPDPSGSTGIPDPSGQGTWPKDNPPTDDITDTPPLHGDPEPQEPVDGNAVPDIAPQIEPLEPGDVGPTENPQDPGVPAGSSPLAPTDDEEYLEYLEDLDDLDDQLVRVGPGTGLLIDPLLSTGAEVKVTGEVVSEGIFSVDGSVLEINGERVQVMDYGDAADLEDEVAGISPDGSSVGTHMVMWIGPPHFFRTETAIVLYVGESPTVIEALTKVIGPQFAGR